MLNFAMIEREIPTARTGLTAAGDDVRRALPDEPAIGAAVNVVIDTGLSALAAVEQAIELARQSELMRSTHLPAEVDATRQRAIDTLANVKAGAARDAVGVVDDVLASRTQPAPHPDSTEQLVRGELTIHATNLEALVTLAAEERYARTLAGPFGRALSLHHPHRWPRVQDTAAETLRAAGDPNVTAALQGRGLTAALTEIAGLIEFIVSNTARTIAVTRTSYAR